MTHVPTQLRRSAAPGTTATPTSRAPTTAAGTRPLPTGLEHLHRLGEAIRGFEDQALLAHDWGTRLAGVLTDGGRLLAVGNGGSAAQAQHLTAELVGRFRDDRSPFSAICLSSETSTLTALVNDYPPEELFARQVEGHGRAGDVLVLMSTSGRSPNVLAAARRGRACGLTVWAMTGPRPNPLADLAHEVLAVDAPATATVQELHLVGLHLVCAAVDAALGVAVTEREARGTLHDGDAVGAVGAVGAAQDGGAA